MITTKSETAGYVSSPSLYEDEISSKVLRLCGQDEFLKYSIYDQSYLSCIESIDVEDRTTVNLCLE